jgi:hypothetical protein
MSTTENETLIPLADTEAVGLGIGRRTIGRRIKNPPPGFPTVLRINGRLYVRRSELNAYKARLIAEAAVRPASGEQVAA